MIAEWSFYLAAAPAVILLGLGKGGFAGVGALSLPLLALVIAPIKGAAIMLPILIVQDVVSVWAYWRKWDVANLKVLFPGAAVGVVLAYLMAAHISDAAFALALGLISVGFAASRLSGSADAPNAAPSMAAGVFWGAVSGFTSMIANTGAPPFQIYVAPQKLPREAFVGTTALFFAVVNWMKVTPFFALGQFTRESLLTSAALLPLAIVSTFAGVLLVRRVSSERFYVLIFWIMALVGLKLIFDGASGLLRNGG